MRIDAPTPQPDNVQSSQVKRAATSGQQSRPAPANSNQDQTKLALDSTTVRQLQASLSQVPEIRQNRVDALRQAVNSGNYYVSDKQLGDAIASDLLSNVVG